MAAVINTKYKYFVSCGECSGSPRGEDLDYHISSPEAAIDLMKAHNLLWHSNDPVNVVKAAMDRIEYLRYDDVEVMAIVQRVREVLS